MDFPLLLTGWVSVACGRAVGRGRKLIIIQQSGEGDDQRKELQLWAVTGSRVVSMLTMPFHCRGVGEGKGGGQRGSCRFCLGGARGP